MKHGGEWVFFFWEGAEGEFVFGVRMETGKREVGLVKV